MNGIIPLAKYGTNLTIFTACCNCEILSSETKCALCKEDVIGADLASDWERERLRWREATKHWRR